MHKILEAILEKQSKFKDPVQRNEIIKWLKTELTYTSNHIEGTLLLEKKRR